MYVIRFAANVSIFVQVYINVYVYAHNKRLKIKDISDFVFKWVIPILFLSKKAKKANLASHS